MSQPGRSLCPKDLLMNALHILPCSGLYSGTGGIDCPQNPGQESSNLSFCAGSSHQTQRLPHILGDRRHMWLSWDTLQQDLGHGEPVFHPDILVRSTPCDGLSQNLQLNQAPDLSLNLSSQPPYIHHNWGLMIHRGAVFLLITRVVPLEAKIRCQTWTRL